MITRWFFAALLFSLVVWALVIYTVGHFIIKFW